jgi:hypothetical protein
MLTISGSGARFCDGLTRRNFLRLGGMSLPQVLWAEAGVGARSAQPRVSHKGIIMVLLPGGGPPHLDMYDLKPEAPAEIRGEFKPIRTNVPGIEICELLQRMAAMMDRLVPIRSLYGARDEHTIHRCVTG